MILFKAKKTDHADVAASCNCTDDGSRSNRNICENVVYIIYFGRIKTASSFSKLFVTKETLTINE